MGFKTKPSQSAIIAGNLQRLLPDARVAYLSATGATEAENLAYTQRLGLWGPKTPFASAENFVTQIHAGGVAAMELVARDMKQLGKYISRGLSFEGVEYERLIHTLSADQREIYDKLVEAWQITLQNFDHALELIASRYTKDGSKIIDKRAKAAALSAYWSTHQRFFNTILCAMQMPSVIADCEKQLADGNTCVLQLVNTNEATMDRMLAKLDEESSLDDIDMTPRDQLLQLIEHCFPINQHEEYVDGNGVTQMRLVTDSKGAPVRNAEAVAMRDKLLTELASIRVPEGPLEMLLNHFGGEQVAEITGRRRRLVRKMVDGIEKVVIEPRSPKMCLADIADFRDDRKRILVFSDAGGTGASYHADPKYPNQRRRIHYLVQAGWIADVAVQGFGRTHRSNQVCPPLYKLVSTDLKGQKRFISTIARRLDQLGALTKGQRQAVGSGMFAAGDNLESSHARDALRKLYLDLFENKVEGITLAAFSRQTGLSLVDGEGNLKQDLPPITRFLNRLLSLQIVEQNRVFDAYAERLEMLIEQAREAGTLDIGVETIRGDRIEKVSERVVYVHPDSKAETKHVEIKLFARNHPLTWDALVSRGQETNFRPISFFARNRLSHKVYAFIPGSDRQLPNGSLQAQYREIGPLTRHSVPITEIRDGANWERIDDVDVARRAWERQVAESPKERSETIHLITGVVLPIWDRLPKDYPRVKRLQITATKEILLGRYVPTDRIVETLRALGVQESFEAKIDTNESIQQLLRGESTLGLANGWLFKRVLVGGDHRIELLGPTSMHFDRVLQPMGLYTEKVNWTPRFFITHDVSGIAVIESVLEQWPITKVTRVK